jgi:bla regulator protein BlaR1
MEYLLKASGLVILLFLFYQLFLKNETFFGSIRSYFLIGLVIVLSIPLIEIPIYVETVATQIDLNTYEALLSNPAAAVNSIDWVQIGILIYLTGILFFTVKFLIELGSLGLLLWHHEPVKIGQFHFVETRRDVPPCSFFNVIIYNKSHYELEELEQVLNHEKAHAMQWHSLDTILAHLLVITLWFNPFVWLYKKAVQQNLEFLADAAALNMARSTKLYQHTLLKTCSSLYCTQISNNFYNSLIKKRIIMLHKNRSNKHKQWRYALLFPLLAAFVLTFNTKVVAQEKKEKEDKTEHTEVRVIKEVHGDHTGEQLIHIQEEHALKLIITSEASDEKLDEVKSKFKEEADITLSFKGIKRNEEGAITAIKIEAKGDNVSAKFANDNDAPIKPIYIAYDSEANSINIGNMNKKSKNAFFYSVHEDDKEGKTIIYKGKPDKKGNYVFFGDKDEKVEWTVKGDKKENVEVVVLDKDGKKKNVWISKGEGDDKTEVHEIEVVEKDGVVKIIESEGGKPAKVLIRELKEGDIEKGEKIFITLSEDKDGKGHKVIKKKKGDMLFVGDGMDDALIIIDGKESSHEELKKLEKDGIEKIEVLKGDNAIEKYGDKAKNGVILVTTKK